MLLGFSSSGNSGGAWLAAGAERVHADPRGLRLNRARPLQRWEPVSAGTAGAACAGSPLCATRIAEQYLEPATGHRVRELLAIENAARLAEFST